MPLPANVGLSLQGHSRPGDTVLSKPKQAMIVRMSAETLEMLEKFPNQPPMDFEFGENPGIYIGETFFPMRPLKENTPHELYLRLSSVAKPLAPLKLYANVTGKFTVERELGEKVQDKVRDRTLTAEKQRTERKAIMLDTPPDLTVSKGKKKKQPALSSMFRKPVQSSDLLTLGHASGHSRAPSRVASPLPSPAITEGLIPLRKQLIHCVALGQHTTEAVIKLVGGADCDPSMRADLLTLLDEVAEPTPVSKKDTSAKQLRLKVRSWLEVRPYEWPGLDEQQRTALSRSARLAYKDLGLKSTDPEWDHVRYRRLSPDQAATPPASGVSNPAASYKTAKTDATTKRSISSTEKTSNAKSESSKIKTEVHAKDESLKRAQKPVNNVANKDDGNRASSANPQARRLPGSGFKVSKTSRQATPESHTPTTRKSMGPADAAIKDEVTGVPSRKAAESHNPTTRKSIGPADAAIKDEVTGVPPRKSVPMTSAKAKAVSAHDRPSMGGQLKKVVSSAITGDSDWERDGGRDKDRGKDSKSKVKDLGKDRIKDGDRGRASPAERNIKKEKDRAEPSAIGTKRKKVREPAEDDVGVASALKKKRKTDIGLSPLPSSSREPESRPRDLSLPKKPDEMPLRKQKRVRDPSPAIPQRRVEKESTPASPPPRQRKKAISPLPSSRSAASHGKSFSVSSSASSIHRREASVDQHERTNGSPSKQRRKSPIYTSSEDEAPLAKRPSPPTPAQPRPRPPDPLPTDREGLRERYKAGYPSYISTFNRVVQQRTKIEAMLKRGVDSRASITDDSDDAKILDEDGLKKLRASLDERQEGLENIRELFDRAPEIP